MINLIHRRIYDIAGITDKSVNVYLNDEKIKIKSFLDYVKLYNDSQKFHWFPMVFQRFISMVFVNECSLIFNGFQRFSNGFSPMLDGF